MILALTLSFAGMLPMLGLSSQPAKARGEDKKAVMVSARRVEGKPDRTGVVTAVVNGVTYLQELDTKNARFIFQNRTNGSK